MLRIFRTPSHILMLALVPVTLVHAQTPAPIDPRAPIPAPPTLSTYTASDGSASASLPAGWTVTRNGETVIVMTSPGGETINLGITFIVKDGPYTQHQKPANGIDLSVPNSASLAEKFTDIIQTAQYVAKATPPLITITSSKLSPATLGFPCATIDGNYSGEKGPFTFRAIVCSLPVDVGGTYKVIAKLWQAPPTIAEQEKSQAEAVLASYRIPPDWLQKKLAPFHTAPAVPVPLTMPRTDSATECFDLAILRGVPNDKLPEYCRSVAPSGPQ